MRISDWSSDVCSSDLIADRGAGQRDLVAEAVERRAQAADDRHRLDRLRAKAIRQRDRIVAADDGAEIAARGELVVKAAVGDQESLAMAGLAVDDAGQIDPRLGDEPAAESHRAPRVRHHAAPGVERPPPAPPTPSAR